MFQTVYIYSYSHCLMLLFVLIIVKLVCEDFSMISYENDTRLQQEIYTQHLFNRIARRSCRLMLAG